MTLNWTPVTVDGFTVREIAEAERWSTAPGDATAETIVEETAWEGGAVAPDSARTMIERWLAAGAWIIGLYHGEALIGLFDVGRFASWAEATGEPVDGAGAIGAEPGEQGARSVHLTLWFAIRPSARGQVSGPVFQALSDAFLRHLWDLGIRRMVTTHVLALEEGRQHAARVERFGWRTVARRGLHEIKAKRLEQRP